MKISPPLATALRAGLYNAAAVLLTMLIGVQFQLGVLMLLFLVLTFPACLIHYTVSTPDGGGIEVWLWFLSPLIWGGFAFGIHAFIIARRRRNNTEAPPPTD